MDWQLLEQALDAGVAALAPGLVTFAAALGAALLLSLAMRTPVREAGGFLLDVLNAIDSFIVHKGSWAVGTRLRRRVPRWLTVTAILFALALAGAFAPVPAAYAALLAGVLAILVVYRHWSWDEDDVASELADDERRVPISGNLRNEVLTAVGFLFLYFPVAFARLQAEGVAFSFMPGSGVVALSAFTFAEFVKALPFVDYYEIFGPELQFERFTNVAGPGLTAKFLILGLRASFDLLLVASLLRLPAIARLVKEGRDLRPVDEALASPDTNTRIAGVEAAKRFALRRRARARDRLIEVARAEVAPGIFRHPREVRIAAAGALIALGERFGDEGALYAACDVLRDGSADQTALRRSRRLNDLGNVLCTIARNRTGTEFLEEALAAYRKALELDLRLVEPGLWAMVQNNLGNVLRTISGRTRDPAAAAEALQAWNAALEVRSPEETPLQWAATKQNLANLLCDRGIAEGSAAMVAEGVAAYREALAVRTKELDPEGWARTQHNLGIALFDLWLLDGAEAHAEESLSALRAALTVQDARETPKAFAMTQMQLGNTLSRLGRARRDAAMIASAVAAYREALRLTPRERAPFDWALIENNLGNALSGLGELRRDPQLLAQAVDAYAAAHQERTRDRLPFDWAATHHNLGNARSRLAALRGDRAEYERAAASWRAALEVRTREADPAGRAATLESLTGGLRKLAALDGARPLLDEALAAAEEALAARPRAAGAYQWARAAALRASVLIDRGERFADSASVEQALAALDEAIPLLDGRDAGEAADERTRAENLVATLRLTREIEAGASAPGDETAPT